MSMENRANSSLFKRAEQLRRWEESETNRVSDQPRAVQKKIKFSDGCVFLSACSANDYSEIDRLLSNGADIDTPNIDGLTALHQACIDDNLDMVEYLVRKGADINKGDNEGWTPLHATASCGFMSIARFLIDHGADVSAVNNDGELPVDIAESDNMEELLQQEIEAQGIDCDAARNMEEDRMMADVNHWISIRQFADRPHPKTGATALHVASAKGYIKVMSLLLRAGSDVNAQDNDGWTPLHASAHWAQREACELLVEHFADMNIKNYAGQTIFDVADQNLVQELNDLKKKQAEDMKKKQASQMKADMLNNLVPRSSVNRLSHLDRSQLITRDVNTERRFLGQERVETNSSASETDVESTEGSDAERRNQSGEESNASSPSSISSAGSDKSKAPSFTPSKPSEDDDGGVPSWRRPGSVRTRPTSIGIILPNNASSPLGVASAPVTPSAEKEELARSLSDSSGAQSTQSTSSLMTSDQDPNDVVLRRTISFDTDTSGNNAAGDPSSTVSSGNGKLPTPAPAVRSDASSKGSTSSQSDKPPAAPVTSVRRSFVPPVRDDESETQRKAHAKQVRATRRSTQGVTLEEIKTAEQIMKQKKPTDQSPVPLSTASTTVPSAPVTTASTTVPSASPPASATSESEDLERRPSWRLRVDDSKSKFTLEEAKVTSPATVATVTPLRPPRGMPTVTPTVEVESQLPNVPIETIAKRIKSVEDVNKDADSKNGAATQLAIQRRRRPKRRSTGVVQVGLEDIDPDRQSQEGDGDEHDDEDESLSDRASSRPSRPASTSSSVAGDSVPPSGRTTPSPTETQQQTEELDYKKLYEEEKRENNRLREQLSENRNELTEAKAKLERSVQVSNARTALSEVEKRERRALERKLSEMEEELKQLQKLKAENEKLKAENRALTRVVTKLTANTANGGHTTS